MKKRAKRPKATEPTAGEQVMVSTAQLAKRYGVCAETIRRWSRNRVIPTIKIGERNFYRPEDVDAALDRFTVKPI